MLTLPDDINEGPQDPIFKVFTAGGPVLVKVPC